MCRITKSVTSLLLQDHRCLKYIFNPAYLSVYIACCELENDVKNVFCAAPSPDSSLDLSVNHTGDDSTSLDMDQNSMHRNGNYAALHSKPIIYYLSSKVVCLITLISDMWWGPLTLCLVIVMVNIIHVFNEFR